MTATGGQSERRAALATLGERLAAVRLSDEAALQQMRSSLERHGQLSAFGAGDVEHHRTLALVHAGPEQAGAADHAGQIGPARTASGDAGHPIQAAIQVVMDPQCGAQRGRQGLQGLVGDEVVVQTPCVIGHLQARDAGQLVGDAVHQSLQLAQGVQGTAVVCRGGHGGLHRAQGGGIQA